VVASYQLIATGVEASTTGVSPTAIRGRCPAGAGTVITVTQ
jgi:hypothetical protein